MPKNILVTHAERMKFGTTAADKRRKKQLKEQKTKSLPDKITKFIEKQSNPAAGKSGYQPFHCPKCGEEMKTVTGRRYKCSKCECVIDERTGKEKGSWRGE